MFGSLSPLVSLPGHQRLKFWALLYRVGFGFPLIVGDRQGKLSEFVASSLLDPFAETQPGEYPRQLGSAWRDVGIGSH